MLTEWQNFRHAENSIPPLKLCFAGGLTMGFRFRISSTCVFEHTNLVLCGCRWEMGDVCYITQLQGA